MGLILGLECLSTRRPASISLVDVGGCGFLVGLGVVFSLCFIRNVEHLTLCLHL